MKQSERKDASSVKVEDKSSEKNNKSNKVKEMANQLNQKKLENEKPNPSPSPIPIPNPTKLNKEPLNQPKENQKNEKSNTIKDKANQLNDVLKKKEVSNQINNGNLNSKNDKSKSPIPNKEIEKPKISNQVNKPTTNLKNAKLAIAGGIGRGKEEDAIILLINNDNTIKVKLLNDNKEMNASKGSGVQGISLKVGDKVKVQVKGILVLIIDKI